MDLRRIAIEIINACQDLGILIRDTFLSCVLRVGIAALLRLRRFANEAVSHYTTFLTLNLKLIRAINLKTSLLVCRGYWLSMLDTIVLKHDRSSLHRISIQRALVCIS